MGEKLKAKGSIINTIRLLILEAGIVLLILYISLRYGEEPTVLVLIGLGIIPVLNIFTAIGLRKFKNRMWVRCAATALSIVIIIPLSIVVSVIFHLIVVAASHIGGAFVIGVVILGPILIIIGWIKEAKRKILIIKTRKAIKGQRKYSWNLLECYLK